jgi:hypothetical protein
MSRRLFNLTAAFSTVVSILIIIASLFAHTIDPRRHHVSITSACHLSIDAHGCDARIELFNDAIYGPYSGSIISMTSINNAITNPNSPTKRGFGDFAGIYYRHFRWRDGTLLWTLSLSLLYPLLVAMVLPMIWIFRRSSRRQRGFPISPSTSTRKSMLRFVRSRSP